MSEPNPTRRPADPPGPTPIIKLRWLIGTICVVVFYGCLFMGVYLDLSANQTAMLTFGISAIPGIAMWLTFVMDPAKKKSNP